MYGFVRIIRYLLALYEMMQDFVRKLRNLDIVHETINRSV
jgi:hypothetical protein